MHDKTCLVNWKHWVEATHQPKNTTGKIASLEFGHRYADPCLSRWSGIELLAPWLMLPARSFQSKKPWTQYIGVCVCVPMDPSYQESRQPGNPSPLSNVVFLLRLSPWLPQAGKCNWIASCDRFFHALCPQNRSQQ